MYKYEEIHLLRNVRINISAHVHLQLTALCFLLHQPLVNGILDSHDVIKTSFQRGGAEIT